MKRVIFALLLALSACGGAPAFAQTDDTHGRTIPLMVNYDLDSTSYQFCSSTGQLGLVRQADIPVKLKVKTTGSTTAVTAVTAGTNPFQNIAVGDILTFPVSGVSPVGTTDSTYGQTVTVYVAARADADNITASSALDLSAGYPFTWRKVTCAATGGWIPVRNASLVQFLLQIDQLNVTGGIDYKVECRQRGAVDLIETQAIGNLTAVGTIRVGITDPYDDCRLGVKIGTSDDGGDLTVNLEKLTAAVTWVVR